MGNGSKRTVSLSRSRLRFAAIVTVTIAATALARADEKRSAGATPAASASAAIDRDAPPPSEPSTEPGAPTICELDPSQCPNLDLDAAAKREIPADVYAVQQIYALRVRRFEISPFWSVSLNDQFVSHPGPGASLSYYITDVVAVGATFAWYAGLNHDSDTNTQARRATRIAVPLTEYQWSAAANVTYVPMYGKLAAFSDFIFHYDGYFFGGGGLLSDRPIAVVDPDNRSFTWKTNFGFDFGVGLRIFVNRWLAAVLEVRDFVFWEQLEATTISPDPQRAATDQSTWYQQGSTATHDVEAHVGVSIFLPFSWEYRLPK